MSSTARLPESNNLDETLGLLDMLFIDSGDCWTDSAGISEVYSPPRVEPYGRKAGFPGGFSLDLTTCDDQGRPWDFNREDCRARARALVR